MFLSPIYYLNHGTSFTLEQSSQHFRYYANVLPYILIISCHQSTVEPPQRTSAGAIGHQPRVGNNSSLKGDIKNIILLYGYRFRLLPKLFWIPSLSHSDPVQLCLYRRFEFRRSVHTICRYMYICMQVRHAGSTCKPCMSDCKPFMSD